MSLRSHRRPSRRGDVYLVFAIGLGVWLVGALVSLPMRHCSQEDPAATIGAR